MKAVNYQIIIPSRLQGMRIDFAMSEMLPELSRSKITLLIKEGSALLNNLIFKAKDKVHGGEIININIKPVKTTNWVPSDIKLDIVFQDLDIIVVNKPAGLITHPGNGNPTHTLANALLSYDKSLELVDRVGIVHRLDKNTSGLLVIARNYKTQQHLIKQLQNRTVNREYNAIVYNHMIAGGTIDSPIGRDSKNRVKQAINENGREAITHYRVIEKFNDFTLIKVNLETGRTHQIRVHMSSINYPLIGDSMYGGKLRFPRGASEEFKVVLKAFDRQALHAKKLGFIHPTTGKQVNFKVDLPSDMQGFLQALRDEES